MSSWFRTRPTAKTAPLPFPPSAIASASLLPPCSDPPGADSVPGTDLPACASNEFQDALLLVTQLESVPLDEKLAQEVSIKRQMGVWIFCQERRFQNGLDILLDARMSPSQVVGLMDKYLSPGRRSLRAGLLATDPEIVLPSSRFEIRKSLRNS